MTTRLEEALKLDSRAVSHLHDDNLRTIISQAVMAQRTDRQENQILYYRPVSPIAEAVHRSRAKYVGIGGGNGASKTDTMLAEATMLATGMFSRGLGEDARAALRAKFRGPITVRVCCTNFITTVLPVILPKLQWWRWSGIDDQGGDRGHWGWVPRRSLRDGTWVRSWSEKTRTLRTLCYDPENLEEVLGESVWQFMAYHQDPPDFASGDVHLVLHDELPPYAIWRENEARTMRVGGLMRLAFTWPDDPSIPVGWVYDQVYEAGQPGPDKDPSTDWFEMRSWDNPNLSQEALGIQRDKWVREGGDDLVTVRMEGRPIHLSSRVHPLFTTTDQSWCIGCGRAPMGGRGCERCGADEEFIVQYNHMRDFNSQPLWPTVFLLDPHPRKPHMGLWVQVDTWDDLWVVAELVAEGGPEEVAEEVREVERRLELQIAVRLGDPSMLRSPSGAQRGVTWQDEFGAVGLKVDLADDSDVGRSRVNDFLRVCSDRKAPRIHFHPRCRLAARQMLRYVWDDYKHPEAHDQKQRPKEKDDDMPTLLKYLMNFGPTWRVLQQGHEVLRPRQKRTWR